MWAMRENVLNRVVDARLNPTFGRGCKVAVVVAGLFAQFGCSGLETEAGYPETYGAHGPPVSSNVAQESVFGPSGVSLFGGDKGPPEVTAAIPVNSFLWRASLDTLSFMPLASADPFGGVIITDWFTPPESTNERFKLTVYILSRELRADGLRVAVFRQLRDEPGNWVDGEMSAETASELENAILTRARQLRIASISQ